MSQEVIQAMYTIENEIRALRESIQTLTDRITLAADLWTQPLFVEGRLTFNQWETDDGQRRNKLTVTVERVQLMGRGNGSGDSDNDSDQGSKADDATGYEDIPF